MTSFSDDFNRADSTDLGSGWVEVSGDWSIVSQQLSPGNAGGTIILRAATAMDSSDHYAQVKIAATAAVSHGPWARGNSNITSGYLLRNNGTSWDLFSVVGGSFTVIGTYAAAAVAGDVVKLQVVGSTIKGFINDVERISVTNTAVTTGTSVGIRGESTNALRYDNFTAADITAGATLGIASAAETAQALTGGKTAALGSAAAAETAQALAGAKAASLGVTGATEVAQPVTGTKTTLLGAPTASEAAQTVTGGKLATLGVAGAVEAAQAIAGSKTTLLGAAALVEEAQPLTSSKSATLGTAVDIEVAQQLAGTKSAALPSAAEVDAAQALAVGSGQSLDTAIAVETARPLTGSKSATLGTAVEVSTARPLATAGRDADGTYTVGAPYTVWAGTVGQPHGSDWGVGEPWS